MHWFNDHWVPFEPQLDILAGATGRNFNDNPHHQLVVTKDRTFSIRVYCATECHTWIQVLHKRFLQTFEVFGIKINYMKMCHTDKNELFLTNSADLIRKNTVGQFDWGWWSENWTWCTCKKILSDLQRNHMTITYPPSPTPAPEASTFSVRSYLLRRCSERQNLGQNRACHWKAIFYFGEEKDQVINGIPKLDIIPSSLQQWVQTSNGLFKECGNVTTMVKDW